MDRMPRWADVLLIPTISSVLAAQISGLVILAIGENPWEALKIMVTGSVGVHLRLGLHAPYYATNSSSPGSPSGGRVPRADVNIGGEGRRPLGGSGWRSRALHPLAALVAGAAWAAGSRRRSSGRPGPRCRPSSRPSGAATSSSRRSCSTSSPPALPQLPHRGPLKPTGTMETASANFPEPTHLPSSGISSPTATRSSSGHARRTSPSSWRCSPACSCGS
jgi:simple sugar transport system permease protein